MRPAGCLNDAAGHVDMLTAAGRPHILTDPAGHVDMLTLAGTHFILVSTSRIATLVLLPIVVVEQSLQAPVALVLCMHVVCSLQILVVI